MEGLVVLALLVALPIQVVAWIAIEIDARRVGLNPHGWAYGVLIPIVGLVVIPAYLYERKHATEK